MKPTTGSALIQDPLVGRQVPLQRLRHALTNAQAGRGGLVVVSGEAGIGKSRLVDELARHSAAPVVRAACTERVGAPAFWPWTQLLRQLLARSGPAPLEHVGAARADVEALVDSSDAAVQVDDVDGATRFRLFDAVGRLVTDIGATASYLVIIEDLHWADPGSLLLLPHVAALLPDTHLLLVVTTRDEEPTDAGVDLYRMGERVPLTGLSVDEVAELVTVLTARPFTAEEASGLARRTGGNPFFLGELVRLLDAEGRTTDRALPPTIRAVVERRLARLSTETHELLGVAAVLGADVDIDQLAHVADLPAEDVLDRLDDATTSGLVSGPVGGRIAFAHALVRETLYAGLGNRRRLELHRRAAAHLAGRGADPSAVGYHAVLAATDAESAQFAIEQCTRAAVQASAMLGFEEAASLYRSAIDALRLVPDAGSRRGPLLIARGEALLRSGDLATARSVYDEAAAHARATSDDDLLIDAALGFSSGLGGFEVRLGDQHQMDLLEEAIAVVDADSGARPLLLARLSVAMSLVESESRRLALADEAVAAARTIGDPVVLAQALAAHCDAIAGPAYTERRLRESTEIVELARRHGAREQELLGLRLQFVALLELGDPSAWAVAGAFERLAETLRQPLYLWYAPLWRATEALLNGKFDEARRLNDEAAQIGARTRGENAVMLTQVQRFMIEYEAGNIERVLGLLADQFIPIGEIAESLPERALAYLIGGRTEEARAILSRAAAVGYWRWDDQERLPALSSAAKVTVALADHKHAERLLPLIAPYSHRVAFEGIGAGCWGALARECGLLAGLLGRYDEARTYLEDAVERNTRAGMPRLADAARADLAALDDSAVGTGAALRRDGDGWLMRWAEREIRIRDAKGVRDLALLLARPGQSVHVLELVANAEGGMSTAAPENTEPVLDRQALAAYRNRLHEIDDELDEAASNADEARTAQLSQEREFLTAELSAALGLGGRVRQTGGSAERARKAVAARIRDTITRVTAQHPALGNHLEHSVRTGTWCVYEPEHPTTWAVT